MIDDAIAELAPLVGKRAACRATGRPQANHYRRHRQSPAPPPPVRDFVATAMAKDPADRFPDAATMADAADTIASRLTTDTPGTPPANIRVPTQ